MGRQINFYMDRKTEEKFQEYILSQDFLIISQDRIENIVVNDLFYSKNGLFITIKEELPNIVVEKYPLRTYIDVYRLNVIEYFRTTVEYEEKKYFGRGRIYVVASYFNNDGKILHKNIKLIKAYEKLVRWIKKNCPMTEFMQDGYNEKAYMSSEIKRLIDEEGYKLY